MNCLLTYKTRGKPQPLTAGKVCCMSCFSFVPGSIQTMIIIDLNYWGLVTGRACADLLGKGWSMSSFIKNSEKSQALSAKVSVVVGVGNSVAAENREPYSPSMCVKHYLDTHTFMVIFLAYHGVT